MPILMLLLLLLVMLLLLMLLMMLLLVLLLMLIRLLLPLLQLLHLLPLLMLMLTSRSTATIQLSQNPLDVAPKASRSHLLGHPAWWDAAIHVHMQMDDVDRQAPMASYRTTMTKVLHLPVPPLPQGRPPG